MWRGQEEAREAQAALWDCQGMAEETRAEMRRNESRVLEECTGLQEKTRSSPEKPRTGMAGHCRNARGRWKAQCLENR